MPENDTESDSADSDSYWNEELIDVIRRRRGTLKVISEEDRIERIEECLIKGAKIDTVDRNGNTALHTAVKRGYLKIVEFLVKKGAQIDIHNVKDQTALTLAEAREDKDILNALEGLTDRGRHLASQQVASTSQATASTGRTAFTSVDHSDMVEDGRRGSSKLKATADKKDSENDRKKRIYFTEEAEAEFNTEKDSQSEDHTIGEKIGGRRRPSPFGGSNRYGAAKGPKNLVHANIYQFKLLMLSLWRGLQRGYPFRLAIEMDSVNKFDDLVFQYKVETERGTSHCFLQAVRKQDETKKITAHNLLIEEDGDFSLQKYFGCYRMIEKDSEFNRSASKDFIIRTNIDFDSRALKSAEIGIKQVDETDGFLDFASTAKKAKRYKFFDIPSRMYEILERTDVHRLAQILVEYVYEPKKNIWNNPLFQLYRNALAREVIDVNRNKFFTNFTKGKNLSERAKYFRKIFCKEASKRFADSLTKDCVEDAVWEEITKYQFQSRFIKRFRYDKSSTEPKLTSLAIFAEELVDLMGNADNDYFVNVVDSVKYNQTAKRGSRKRVFAGDMKKLARYVFIMEDNKIKFRPQLCHKTNLPGNLKVLRNLLKDKLGEKYKDLGKYQFKMPTYFEMSDEKLPGDKVNNNDIKRFFEQLVFAVNQPDEIELGNVITSEIGTDNPFNLLNADLAGPCFEEEILDWFKKKGEETKQAGGFYSDTVAGDFFDSIQQKVYSLVASGPSLSYRKELERYGITFEDENEVLKNFLSPDSGDGARSVLNLIAARDTMPTAIRVHQAIQWSGSYQMYDSLMFLRLRTLLLPDVEARVTLAFKSLDSHHLLVIDCESATELVWGGLYGRLSQTMEEMAKMTMKKNHKKLILITRDEEPPSIRAGVLSKNCFETRDNVSFQHLTTGSQLTLMKEKVICFRGDQQRISFVKLLDISCRNNRRAMQDLGSAIDTGILTKLIRRKEIRIGSDLKGLGEVANYYIRRRIDRRVIIKDDIFEAWSEFDKIAVSTSEENAPKFRGILLERGQEAEEFEKLCEESRENVHWLKYVSGEFLWYRSRGDIIFLMKHRDVSENRSSNNYEIHKEALISLTEDQLADHDDGQKVVIISDSAGTGKTTMFTHLAKKIKEKKPGHWVIEIDLNDFTRVLDRELEHKQLERRSSYASDTDGAVRFLVEKLSKLKTQLDKKVLETMMKNLSKVVLLFDGFDKVSPEHTDMVIDLLQGLKEVGMAKLFVATRPHMRVLLEEKLGTFSYTIKSFSEGDQIDFLIRFWKEKLRLDVEPEVEQQLETDAKTLMEKVVQSIGATAKEVVSVPAQLRVIAEFFQGETYEEYLNSGNYRPKLPLKLNVVDLYRAFVQSKFFTYNTEGKKNNASNPGVQDDDKNSYRTFLKRHQKSALHTLFNVKSFDHSSGVPIHPYLLKPKEIEEINTHMTEIIEGRGRTSIVTHVVNGRAQFIHNFAEYFAATFISDTLLKQADHDPEVRQFIVANILLGPRSKVIRVFLDGLLLERSQQSDDRLAFDAGANDSWKEDLSTWTCQCNTIFDTAAAEGHYEIVKYFLNRIDQHETRKELISVEVDWFSPTVLRIIADRQKWDEVMWLIENGGAEANSLIWCGRTVLHAAASGDNLDVVKWLVKQGAFVDAPDDHGKTPLHEAARSGRLDILKWLVEEKNIDVNSRYENGVTLLHCAASAGKIPLLEWLIEERDAEVNAVTDDQETVVLYAARAKNWDAVRHLADSYNAVLEVESRFGDTVSLFAIKQDNLDMVKWLVDDRGISIGLTYAVVAGGIDVVKWLICENNADPNEVDTNGCTPLIEALDSMESEISEWLVEDGGADVNAKDNCGMTPLHMSAELPSYMIRKLVNDYGADIYALNNRGERPVDLYGDGPDRELLEFGPR